MGNSKLKKILTKVICLVLVAVIPQISSDMTLLKVWADTVQYQTTVSKLCEESPLLGYNYLQAMESTGTMNYETEERLNYLGVTDSEIAALPEDMREGLENAEDIMVSIQYIEYSEKSEEGISGISIAGQQDIGSESDADIEEKEVEARVLSPEEVDELIHRLYFEDNNETSESFLSKLGLTPVTAYAVSSSNISDKNYLKKVLIAYQNGDYVQVSVTCTWLTTPIFKQVDFIAVKWTGGILYSDSTHKYSAKVKYDEHKSTKKTPYSSYVYTDTYGLTDDYTSSLKNQPYTDMVGLAFDMPQNLSEDPTGTYSYYSTSVSNISISMSFWVKNKNKEKSFTCDLYYDHQKSIVKIENTISFVAKIIKFVKAPTIQNGYKLFISGSKLVTDLLEYYAQEGNPCHVYLKYK